MGVYGTLPKLKKSPRRKQRIRKSISSIRTDNGTKSGMTLNSARKKSLPLLKKKNYDVIWKPPAEAPQVHRAMNKIMDNAIPSPQESIDILDTNLTYGSMIKSPVIHTVRKSDSKLKFKLPLHKLNSDLRVNTEDSQSSERALSSKRPRDRRSLLE